jgi:hypothetical protein
MPVTARLSKLFYERLGEQIANELVDWFNAVDATYRADLRELNEQNFARFDAKLEQRFAELRAELLGELRSEIAALRVDMHALKTDLIKWMFGFWAVSLLTTAGAIAALARLVP